MPEEAEVRRRVSTLAHIGIITKYNFLNYFRARRFYVMLAIILIISGLLTALVGYYRPPGFVGVGALGFYGAGWGRFVSFVIILSAAFFGGDAISGEFQNRTGYFLVPNPVRRSAIYIGKWIAALIASTIVLMVFALIMVANGLFYFPGTIPWEFAQSVVYAWIYVVAALSLTFAFSSLFKSSSISILMSVILLLFVFPLIDEVAMLVAGIEPWFSLTYGAGIVANVLTVPFPAHMTTGSPFGGGGGPGSAFTVTTFNASLPEGLAILGIYFVVMAVLGLWIFERKEFTS
jgi:ABC-2 type transport system permease protein